jgi:GNAT superfamily N-acetyltransferase
VTEFSIFQILDIWRHRPYSEAMEVTIREFLPGDEGVFRRLNEEWIVRHFVLEAKDTEALADPQGNILDRGGRIFFAVRNGEMLGCCALLAMGSGEYEVAKMAVTEAAQGQGIGRRLLEHAIAAARADGATVLHLETNRKLTPAIRLYESVGFRHLPAERFVPSPYARSNVQMEMELGSVAQTSRSVHAPAGRPVPPQP